ncbi:hypothetical protein RZS08_12625, partial [Arthrospira platensis SPKY1]|nr:hypothetical protein [Arthrospira platensis SPKY1]
VDAVQRLPEGDGGKIMTAETHKIAHRLRRPGQARTPDGPPEVQPHQRRGHHGQVDRQQGPQGEAAPGQGERRQRPQHDAGQVGERQTAMLDAALVDQLRSLGQLEAGVGEHEHAQRQPIRAAGKEPGPTEHQQRPDGRKAQLEGEVHGRGLLLVGRVPSGVEKGAPHAEGGGGHGEGDEGVGAAVNAEDGH